MLTIRWLVIQAFKGERGEYGLVIGLETSVLDVRCRVQSAVRAAPGPDATLVRAGVGVEDRQADFCCVNLLLVSNM